MSDHFSISLLEADGSCLFLLIHIGFDSLVEGGFLP